MGQVLPKYWLDEELQLCTVNLIYNHYNQIFNQDFNKIFSSNQADSS